MKLDKIIKEEMARGDLLDVLKACQAEEGYLTEDAIRQVAAVYGKFPSEIYETATFYSMLSVNKKAEHVIEVCGSTCCDAAEAKAVMDAIASELGIGMGEMSEDGKWLWKRVECLGRCDTAPNVIIDGELMTNAAADEVVAKIRSCQACQGDGSSVTKTEIGKAGK